CRDARRSRAGAAPYGGRMRRFGSFLLEENGPAPRLPGSSASPTDQPVAPPTAAARARGGREGDHEGGTGTNVSPRIATADPVGGGVPTVARVVRDEGDMGARRVGVDADIVVGAAVEALQHDDLVDHVALHLDAVIAEIHRAAVLRRKCRGRRGGRRRADGGLDLRRGVEPRAVVVPGVPVVTVGIERRIARARVVDLSLPVVGMKSSVVVPLVAPSMGVQPVQGTTAILHLVTDPSCGGVSCDVSPEIAPVEGTIETVD